MLEGRAAREPASIVFCFRWVSPHREGTDNAISRAGWGQVWVLPWSECSGADEVVSRHLVVMVFTEESPRLSV